MTADVLQMAETLIRERAELAASGRWVIGKEQDGVFRGRYTVIYAHSLRRVVTVGQTRPHHTAAEANVTHIAALDPQVALALADMLRVAMSHQRDVYAIPGGVRAHCVYCGGADGRWPCEVRESAEDLARSYLRMD